MNRLGIFGTSGFAREVADVGAELGYEPLFVARDRHEADAFTLPGDVILESELDHHADIPYAIGIGDNAVRERVARRHLDRLAFPTLIHPSASFGRGQREAIAARRGVIVCAGVRFTNNIQVGDFTIFNLNATIGHDVIVDDFANVAPGACISGNVHLATGCWIGTGAAVIQGTNEARLVIGARTTVGAGAVVSKNCDEDAVYVGIPARRVR